MDSAGGGDNGDHRLSYFAELLREQNAQSAELAREQTAQMAHAHTEQRADMVKLIIEIDRRKKD